MDATGGVPPGNAPGETKWQQRRARPAKPDIRLTPGKGLQDLSCSVEDLVDQVVKTAKVRGCGTCSVVALLWRLWLLHVRVCTAVAAGAAGGPSRGLGVHGGWVLSFREAWLSQPGLPWGRRCPMLGL